MRTSLVSFVVVLAVLVAAPVRADDVLFEQTLVVALKGVEVGKIVGRDKKLDDGTIEVRRDATLNLDRGATKNEITTSTIVKLTPDRKPVSFTYSRTDKGGTLKLDGVIKNGQFVMGGKPTPFPADGTFSLGFEHETRLALKDGFHAQRRVVLEEMGAPADMIVDVKKKGAGFLITSTLKLPTGGELVTDEEVDAKGQTIVARTPGVGIVAYPPGRAPADLAKGNADLLAVSTWKVKPVHPPVARVKYRIAVENAAKFIVPEDDRQKIVKRDAGSIEIDVKSGVASKAAITKERKAKLLESTPYEDVTDAAIVKAAADATKGAKTKREEVEKLTKFVFGHVEAKGLDRGYAPATATLASRAGDCTEHSVLLSALLRARGIPTRLVDGVVVDGDRAGYHEWVEAYLEGEGFVPADPTFGQFPAGPERLKLAEGSTSPEEHLTLSLAAARLLGQSVTLEVLEAK